MISAATPAAFGLFHDAQAELSRVEAAGIRIDTAYLERTRAATRGEIKTISAGLRNTELFNEWRKRYGEKTNLGSREQLGRVLSSVLRISAPVPEGKTRPSWDAEALGGIDHPFVRDYVRLEKLKKIDGTFLAGIFNEVEDGFLHPFFSLNTVVTFRSSSSDPNFQNLPIRDAELSPIVRRAFIAREGNHLVENDFGGIEVRIAACYHKDPTMLEYILDPTRDMHRDMAGECYAIPADRVPKDVRATAKGMFVFAQFYGSYWLTCANNLWNAIGKYDLRYDGASIYEHLRDRGITELGDGDARNVRPGTFEAHIRDVEDRFWNERFPQYTAWKKAHYAKYQERGWFSMKSGFVCRGIYSRNETINYPIQGWAFHCLLWTLVQVSRELRRRKMTARIVGQIHDSIIGDVPPNELEEYLAIVKHYATVAIREHWPAIIVPLVIEAEVAPIGGTWADKKNVPI